MAIQHSNITDPQIHEPKGAAGASPNTVYVADGSGSGAWSRIDPSHLKNNSVNFSEQSRHVVVNSSGGFGTVFGPSAASIGFTGNSSPTALTTAFKTLSGSELPWANNVNMNGNPSASTGEIIAPYNGVYELSVTFAVETGTVDGLKLMFKSSPPGVVFWETVHQPESGKKDTVHLSTLVQLSEGDGISIQAASEVGSGNIVFITGDFKMKLIGDGT